MKYSRNVFGNYFYLPSQEELKTLKAWERNNNINK
jgi:hypothetical protein